MLCSSINFITVCVLAEGVGKIEGLVDLANQATGYVHLRSLNFIVLFQGSVQFIFATRAVHSIPYLGAVVNQTLVNVVIFLESFTNQICSGASLLK